MSRSQIAIAALELFMQNQPEKTTEETMKEYSKRLDKIEQELEKLKRKIDESETPLDLESKPNSTQNQKSI